MIKRIVPFALLGATIFGLASCGPKDGFKKTPNGLEYRIVKDAPGDKKPVLGDIVELHIITKVGDSELFSTYKMNNNQPVSFPLMQSAFKGDMPEGVMMMTVGDSAVFHVSLDSIKKTGAQILPFMKDKKFVEYDVVLVGVKSQKEAQAEQQAKAAEQKGVDDKILQDFFTKNNIKPEKTASGLYFVINKAGAGAPPKPGQEVTVNYTGKSLEGKAFDSNLDPKFGHVKPLSFVVGQGQVIPGWDEGVSLLGKGAKATLYIPSTLAYGTNGQNPNIPANGILMFDVEVLDIKDAPAANAAAQQAPPAVQ